MNSRNLEYIRAYNLKENRVLADDKLLSKRVLKKNGITVPDLIAKIKNHDELEKFDWQSLPASFALKPNRGFGGEGIIVVYGKKKERDDAWIKADGSLITIEDLKTHIRNILDGSFSLAGTPDIAFFEERLRLLKLFKPYAYKGIPDIRVIVFNKVPVMAMMRIPTRESQGKANLQQGAIGVGIDLASGITTTAVLGKGKLIDYVPGTRMLLSGIRIPFWNDILDLSVRAQIISGLGYLGTDIAIDKENGPVIVELNARPGLSIQIANLAGLKERLERVENIKIKTPKRGISLGMNLFGGEVEEEVEEISGRKVIGTVEKVRLIGKEEKEIEVEAKIDTGAGLTSIDTTLARELGFGKTIDEFQKQEFPADISTEEARMLDSKEKQRLLKEIPDIVDTAIIRSSHGTSYRPMVKIAFIMNDVKITAKASIIDRSNLKFPIIIGKKNLGKFLIDVNKIINLSK
ncbi:MAG TPA: sugar-transfer associated ATP-grasp domain-containing protein [Candidatus Moranbacteria bacterium]|nr:sugar-transfer associated ATP-grasp domain-containing protein [Candidatus Moranbacteria bacterium]